MRQELALITTTDSELHWSDRAAIDWRSSATTTMTIGNTRIIGKRGETDARINIHSYELGQVIQGIGGVGIGGSFIICSTSAAAKDRQSIDGSIGSSSLEAKQLIKPKLYY